MKSNDRDLIILGGLLHDVGKFMQRAGAENRYAPESDMAHNLCPKDGKSGRTTHHHVLYTATFMDSMIQPLLSHCIKDEDAKRVSNLAAQHHYPNEQFPEQCILQKADRYSSGTDRQTRDESDESQNYKKFRQTRLKSVFSEVQLGKEKGPARYYEVQWLSPCDPACISPDQQKEQDEALVDQYSQTWKRFVDEVEKLYVQDLPAFNQALDALLLHATWAIPSSTVDKPNISLYDHSLTTASIAAALYDYHAQNDTLNVEAIADDDTEKFLLVGGDISGIQNFIFNLDPSHSRGAAKILRARSFYLAMFTRAVIMLIEKRLGLSGYTTLFNAGGGFTLLLPNTEKTRETLDAVSRQMDESLLTPFAGELSLLLNGETRLSGKDFREDAFHQKLEELQDRMAREKLRKHHHVLIQNGKWQDSTDLLARDYEDYQTELCTLSGYGAATATYQKTRVSPLTKALIQLGQKLTAARSVSLGPAVENPDVIFFGGEIGLSVSSEMPRPRRGQTTFALNTCHNGLASLYMANFVPRVQETEIGQMPEDEDNDFEQIAGDPRNMAQIAHKGPAGAPFLGLLKADVDNLGLITSEGLGAKRSLSRYVTFGRMMDFFFSGRLPALMADPPQGKNFDNIYTVFAGGDDLFLISDWQTALDFTAHIRKEFARYVGHNPALHFSAAHTLLKPRQPIRAGARIAEENLEAAKEAGRNRIALFSEVIPWEDYDTLAEYAQFLNQAIQKFNQGKEKKEKGGLSIQFVRRLLHYHALYKRSQEGDVRALIYRSHLKYDVARNLDKRKDKSHQSKEQVSEEAQGILQLLEDKNQEENVRMRYLRVPVSWALYQNRGGKAE